MVEGYRHVTWTIRPRCMHLKGKYTDCKACEDSGGHFGFLNWIFCKSTKICMRSIFAEFKSDLIHTIYSQWKIVRWQHVKTTRTNELRYSIATGKLSLQFNFHHYRLWNRGRILKGREMFKTKGKHRLPLPRSKVIKTRLNIIYQLFNG